MKMYKHGIPGIGVTAQTGKTGKKGNGIYFGTLDSFFTYIGDNIPADSSIDYTDIDYDITYVQNEERLNFIYKTGDILYITDDDKKILYMVEITDDLTTCTKEYLLDHIKYNKPYTIKYSIDDVIYQYPLNIVYNDVSSNNVDNLYNLNKLYYKSLISLIYDSSKFNIDKTNIDILQDVSVHKNTFKQIPYKFKTIQNKEEYINTGELINKYNYEHSTLDEKIIDSSKNLIQFISLEDNNSSIFSIKSVDEQYISLSSSDNLFITNLCVKNTNLGNVESYYTLYNQDLILDEDGNCYTLQEKDFNNLSLTLDKTAFFKDKTNINVDDYQFGYIHTLWNYDENNEYTKNKFNYYKPNFIIKEQVNEIPEEIERIKVDEFGNYVRNFNDSSFNSISNIYVREQLINLPDNKTINDVSNLLTEVLTEDELLQYLNYNGIIETEKIDDYKKYQVITQPGLYNEYYIYEDGTIYINSKRVYIYNIQPDEYRQYIIHTDTIKDGYVIYGLANTNIFIKNDTLISLGINVYNSSIFDPDAYTELDKVYYNIIEGSIKISDLLSEQDTNMSSYINYLKQQSQGSTDEYPDYIEDENGDAWFITNNVDDDRFDFIVKPGVTGTFKVRCKSYYDHKVIDSVLKWNITCINPGDNVNIFINRNPNKNELYQITEEEFNEEVDIKYNSSLITSDYSNNKINLNIKDKFNNIFEHQNIIQWILAPNGFKYYSKLTKADFNKDTNTFDISTNYINVIPEKTDKPGFVDLDTIGEENLFDINLTKNTNNNYYTLKINSNIKDDQIYVKEIEVYQNSSLICVPTPFNDHLNITNIGNINTIDVNEYLDDTDILNKLYNNEILLQNNDDVLFTIKYSVNDETVCKHITTYKYKLGNYNEYRTIPDIKLNITNDMESLEQLNKIENGILCNQLQYFINIKIDNFNSETWGKLLQYYKTLKLDLELTLNPILTDITHNSENNIDTNMLKIKYSCINPDIDIYTSSQKILEDENNLHDITVSNNKIKVSFTLDELNKITNDFKIRVLIETTNPEPVYYENYVNLTKLEIAASDKVFKLNQEYLTEFKSEPIKMVIAPISMIASYNQDIKNISNIGLHKWYGSEDEITVSVKPYKLNEVIQQYSTYRGRQESDTKINWSALKFKLRFLQDNIKSINIKPLNINYIYELLPDRLYNPEFLADDPDDIFDTYLQIIYNSDIFNPELYEDSEVISYNNINYLASQYGQLKNNTALFIKQEIEHLLRTDTLLNSMKTWNDLYENEYKYDSDNPYRGHVETYGNGYQYLPKTADYGQYLGDNIMLLENVKNINNSLFFDLTDNKYFEHNLSTVVKYDDYIPQKYFRTLLYNMKWIYPKYFTKDGISSINQYPIIENKLDENYIYNNEMPYNLTYSLYPRIMFNDEEQVNIILMLRLPSIIEENQYQLIVSDLKYNIVSSIEELEDPINVMN